MGKYAYVEVVAFKWFGVACTGEVVNRCAVEGITVRDDITGELVHPLQYRVLP